MKDPLLPNLFVVGAAKCGTTSVYEFLRAHPKVYMSPVKEPLYFNDTVDNEKKVPRWEDYLALFSDGRGMALRGEASPSYLYYARSPGWIHDRCPDANIVICLRDPTERAYANYLMDHREGYASGSFYDELLRLRDREDELCWGREHIYIWKYADQVQRYFDVFGRERVHIILFDDLVADASAVARSLCEFLKIDNATASATMSLHNPYTKTRFSGHSLIKRRAGLRRTVASIVPGWLRDAMRPLLYVEAVKPAMDPRARELLDSIFRADVDRLEPMIGRRLDHWCRGPQAAGGARRMSA